MSNPLLINVIKSQDEYLKLITGFQKAIEQDSLSMTDIAIMTDEIKCFWLKRLEAIEFELDELVENHSCFLLSGAIYLNISEMEHYYFKSLGDFHFLPDPFLKQRNFSLMPHENLDVKETVNYFRRVYNDTVEILTNYENHFYFIPLTEIAVKDKAKHQELLNKISEDLILSSLNKDINNLEEFYDTYELFEDIEKDMRPNTLDYFTFSNFEKTGMSLREKIELYIKKQFNCSAIIKGKTESQIFYISTYSWIAQIADILLTSLYMRMIPYIRFNVTFNYLVIIMHNFIDNDYIKATIEKTIIFYILYQSISTDSFKTIEFEEYCDKLQNRKPLSRITNKMNQQNIDISKGGIRKAESIIIEEFNDIFKMLRKA